MACARRANDGAVHIDRQPSEARAAAPAGWGPGTLAATTLWRGLDKAVPPFHLCRMPTKFFLITELAPSPRTSSTPSASSSSSRRRGPARPRACAALSCSPRGAGGASCATRTGHPLRLRERWRRLGRGDGLSAGRRRASRRDAVSARNPRARVVEAGVAGPRRRPACTGPPGCRWPLLRRRRSTRRPPDPAHLPATGSGPGPRRRGNVVRAGAGRCVGPPPARKKTSRMSARQGRSHAGGQH